MEWISFPRTMSAISLVSATSFTTARRPGACAGGDDGTILGMNPTAKVTSPLFRRELEFHRGREVKRTGDGFLATFDGPARAIRCAASVTEAVAELGLELRAGLHTGELEVMSDDDLGGLAVHIAARVMGAAGAGEVLVSGTVKDLVVGSGIDFEDRGLHELKGLDEPRQLFAVRS